MVKLVRFFLQETLAEMPDDPVRLQLLLHHRDKQLDELAERFKEQQMGDFGCCWLVFCSSKNVDVCFLSLKSPWKMVDLHFRTLPCLTTQGVAEGARQPTVRGDLGQTRGGHPESCLACFSLSWLDVGQFLCPKNVILLNSCEF